uniref:Uncharacterized protein n=1 Tax=Arundo donax TaxID=35708 RepID=A0A0A9HT00_ARUDO
MPMHHIFRSHVAKCSSNTSGKMSNVLSKGPSKAKICYFGLQLIIQ